MKAKLILENKMEFEGTAFGYLADTSGEVVFNTSMSGYQELLTDPSCFGQIVVMTYPLIGNYGINLDDSESDKPQLRGLIVRESAKNPNNFRCELELDDYLKANRIVGIEGIDTRALAKVLRTHGTMTGYIITEGSHHYHAGTLQKAPAISSEQVASQVSTKHIYRFCTGSLRIALLDFGVKKSTLHAFRGRGCQVTVFPFNASIEEILRSEPQLLVLSDGPGDPAELSEIAQKIRTLADTLPTTGIGLGHQLLALAYGGRVSKLPFGHRGANHPVKNLDDERVYISAQNHGYYVDALPEHFTTTHISVNDSTNEGMRHVSKPIRSVQFDPAGTAENDHLFDEFIRLTQEVAHA